MAELLQAVASWPSLVLVVVVFGFAPGFCLRLIVLAYPRSDPRRDELIAELYAVPRLQRPLWVAEQLEVALFEGLAHCLSAVIRSLDDRRRARWKFVQGHWVTLQDNRRVYIRSYWRRKPIASEEEPAEQRACPDCQAAAARLSQKKSS
jgi:hypothetical protein